MYAPKEYNCWSSWIKVPYTMLDLLQKCCQSLPNMLISCLEIGELSIKMEPVLIHVSCRKNSVQVVFLISSQSPNLSDLYLLHYSAWEEFIQTMNWDRVKQDYWISYPLFQFFFCILSVAWWLLKKLSFFYFKPMDNICKNILMLPASDVNENICCFKHCNVVGDIAVIQFEVVKVVI